MWEAMFLHEGWRELVKYLEGRYVQIGMEPCDSLIKLSARNARLNEIKKLFAFISHDFRMEEALIREYQSMSEMDEMILPNF